MSGTKLARGQHLILTFTFGILKKEHPSGQQNDKSTNMGHGRPGALQSDHQRVNFNSFKRIILDSGKATACT